jgi:hypothetical protein
LEAGKHGRREQIGYVAYGFWDVASFISLIRILVAVRLLSLGTYYGWWRLAISVNDLVIATLREGLTSSGMNIRENHAAVLTDVHSLYLT